LALVDLREQLINVLCSFRSQCRWFNSQSRSITDWLYEIKHDGFHALAVIEQGQCRFLSRKKHKLTGHQDLRAVLVKEVNAETAVLDGELVVADMMQRRHPVRYFAFDLLWLNGEDLRQLLRLTPFPGQWRGAFHRWFSLTPD